MEQGWLQCLATRPKTADNDAMSSRWWKSDAPHWNRRTIALLTLLGILVTVVIAIQGPGVVKQLTDNSGGQSEPPVNTDASSTTEPSTGEPSPEGGFQEITEARIEISDTSDLIAPGTIDAGRSPGFEPYVFTADGRLGRDDGCYVNWEVYVNSQLVHTDDTRCEKEPSFSETFWPSHLEVERGTMRVVAHISTEWGATENAELALNVR